jgi:hypothetical protein
MSIIDISIEKVKKIIGNKSSEVSEVEAKKEDQPSETGLYRLTDRKIIPFPTSPFKAKRIQDIIGEDGNIIFDTPEQEAFKGINPFVDQIKPEELAVDTSKVDNLIVAGIIADENINTASILEAPIDKVRELNAAIETVIELREKIEARKAGKPQILKLEKTDDIAA